MKRLRIFTVFLFCVVHFLTAEALTSDTPPDIIASLPRMCLWQYVPSAKNNPDFMFPGPDCGPFSNHFCPGLVHIALAERAKELSKKEIEYNMARTDMEYTLNFTQEYPECVLRPIAQRNLIRIKSEQETIKILLRNRRTVR